MTRSPELVVRQLVDEGVVEKLLERVRDVLCRRELPESVRCPLEEISEALSGGDWQKLGALFGILWYKLDRITSALDPIQRSSSGSEVILRDIARSLTTIAQRLR